MSNPEEIANALLAVEASAAHLERIAQSQDEEFRRLVCEFAQNLRLVARMILTLREIGNECDSSAAQHLRQAEQIQPAA